MSNNKDHYSVQFNQSDNTQYKNIPNQCKDKTPRMENIKETHRQERDSLGTVWVDKDHFWGAQTQRAKFNFHIGHEKVPGEIIRALGLIKASAAVANKKLNCINENFAQAIFTTGLEIFHGQWLEHCQLPIWQSGSGTQTNMNINEVIANLAARRLNLPMGLNNPIHANDHINLHQSTNDTFISAIHMSLVLLVKQKLLPILNNIIKDLEQKTQRWHREIKIGRTHLQDAVPMTVGQEFSAFLYNFTECINQIKYQLQYLRQLPLGGTAIGTGIGSKKRFSLETIQEINAVTKEKFIPVGNNFAYISMHQALLNLSASFNTLATVLLKLCQDLQLLSSGPRCGLAELIMPNNEPGSSIMPGKANPNQTEALQMICVQVMSHHFALTIGNSRSTLQLNTYRPLMAYNLITSIHNLTDALSSFFSKCLVAIEINHTQNQYFLQRSLLAITAIANKIGHDKAAQILKRALQNNRTLQAEIQKDPSITAEDIKLLENYYNLV